VGVRFRKNSKCHLVLLLSVAESSAPPEPNQLLDQDPSPLVRPDAVLRWLKEGHERFLDGHSIHPHTTRERMRAVVEGQHPLAAVLGCADSRVPVELLFNSGFGDLFVVRNAGTMSTTAAIASLEYAVGHLDVSLVVVLGHEVHSSVLLTDRVRAGHLAVVAGYYDLHSSAIDWMGHVEPIRYPGPAQACISRRR
jgi:hypothetical protein